MRLSKITFLLVGLVFLLGTSCATPALQSARHSTFQKGDKDLLASIIKEEESFGFHQEGLASWYGPGFYGHKTASGTRFSKMGFTCAHRTLPFGTRLEVTNVETGKTIDVMVNDRGPYVAPRILDLSYAAARELGVLKHGTAQVALKEKKKEEPRYSQLSASSLSSLITE